MLENPRMYSSNALISAYNAAKEFGSILSLPQLIDLRIQDKSSELWNTRISTISEEIIGTTAGHDPKVLIIHGGGIITGQHLVNAHENGYSINSGIRFSREDAVNALEGKIRDMYIPIFHYKDFSQYLDVSELPERYGIVIDYKKAFRPASGFCTKKQLLKSPLAIARAGGKQRLERYIDAHTSFFSTTAIGFSHLMRELFYTPKIPEARFLHLSGQDGFYDRDDAMEGRICFMSRK